MKFLSGGSGLLEMLNIEKTMRYKAIRMVDEIRDQTEVLIVDAPAGASDSSIDFVAAADRVVIVLVGEPTSFLDAYALIKAANIEAGVKHFNVVVNMANSRQQARSHFDKFNAIATRFLDVSLNFAGHVPLSQLMRRAVINRKPIGMEDASLSENLAFAAISKAVLSAPSNENSGIRFFSDNAMEPTG
jgi:flagellar biosynthesis protein FlhG